MSAPIFVFPKFKAFVPGTGNPAASYWVKTFQAGTSLPLSLFADPNLTVPAGNPFSLDLNGEAVVYGQPGVAYKMQLLFTDAVTPITGELVDGILLGGGGSGGGVISISEWQQTQLAPTYISGTSFSVAGNQTALFAPGLRIQTQNNAGIVYSTVVSSAFSTLTTVTVVNDSGSLDSGLSVVLASLQAPGHLSQPQRSIVSISHANGTAIASNTAYILGENLTPTKNIDIMSEFSTATGTFTPLEPGWYRIAIQLNLSNLVTTGTAAGNITLKVNGVTVAVWLVPLVIEAANANSEICLNFEHTAFLAAGVAGFQATFNSQTFSAGTLQTASSAQTQVIGISRVG